MASCCEDNCAVEALRERQRGTLIRVLVINTLMFVVIFVAAWYGKSTALLSDCLDNLGDAITYGLSLFAISRSGKTKARVALFKGGLIFAASAGVMVQIVHRLMSPALPSFEIMGFFSIAGLAANGICLYLLWRHRAEDINMSSVYECSRNDIASNLSVVIAAAGVWALNNHWPDLVVASFLAVLLLMSSARVIRNALTELRRP